MDTRADPIADLLEGPEDGSALVAERCHRALRARDVRFDGRFFVGVTTTGIFCRPVCPAPTPKPSHCTYWRSAAAALGAGFRPCLRCRPEVAPGTPAWRGTAASVSRALRLIEAGALDGDGSVEALASRLGMGSRHLRRLFEQHLGTTPRAVAKLRRALFAKQLITETALPMTEVALAAGFSSQRRFNACMREVYGRPPMALRDSGRGRAAVRRDARVESPDSEFSASRTIELALPYRRPYAWRELIGFLRDRAIPGVESIDRDCYARTFREGEGVGSLLARIDDEKSVLRVEVRLSSIGSLVEVNGRLRRLFDVDADSEVIDAVLRRVRSLRSQVRRIPGMRVPGAFDGFETAVRAILGQQISVKGATTFAGRIAQTWGQELARELAVAGSLRVLFPEPADLVEAPLETIGLTRARADTIRGLARAVLEDPDLTRSGADLERSTARWESLAGIGPWTAHYVAMRVLREPDALPIGDLGLRKAITEIGEEPRAARDVEKTLEVCRPYRAYAAVRLWESLRRSP